MMEDRRSTRPQLEALGRLADAIDEATVESRTARDATDANTEQLKAEKHWRKLATRIAVSCVAIILAIFVSFAIFVITVLSRESTLIGQNKVTSGQLSQVIHAEAMHRCEDTNAFRLDDQTKWEHILSLITPPPTATLAQRAATAKFVADILGLTHQQDTPIDCAKLP